MMHSVWVIELPRATRLLGMFYNMGFLCICERCGVWLMGDHLMDARSTTLWNNVGCSQHRARLASHRFSYDGQWQDHTVRVGPIAAAVMELQDGSCLGCGVTAMRMTLTWLEAKVQDGVTLVAKERRVFELSADDVLCSAMRMRKALG